MRLENKNERDESTVYRYAEDRLNKPKKKKKSIFLTMLMASGYLAAIVIVLYVIGLVSSWIDGEVEKTANDFAVSTAGDGVVVEEEMVTRAEADALVEEAVSKAMEEAATEKAQAIEAAKLEVLDGIQAGLETGDQTMVEVLRPFYPNDIVVVSGGKFNFVPINWELKLNPYDEANLNILESGEYQYMDGENVISHKGIDVSRFQGKIDWKAVADDGVEFAFLRVANRGYGTGKLVEDDTFEKNMEGALAAGIHVGVYIYSQAIDEDEVREEAQLVLDKVAPFGVKCPIVFDVEKSADASGRMNQLPLEERTNLTLLFCQIIEEAGYKPIIYHNVEMGSMLLDIETLEDYDKWLAYYNDDMYYPYDYKIWQYSDKGTVNGIKGHVDLNISFEKFWEE